MHSTLSENGIYRLSPLSLFRDYARILVFNTIQVIACGQILYTICVTSYVGTHPATHPTDQYRYARSCGYRNGCTTSCCSVTNPGYLQIIHGSLVTGGNEAIQSLVDVCFTILGVTMASQLCTWACLLLLLPQPRTVSHWGTQE